MLPHDIDYVISIQQPWLLCITDYHKRAENRTWKPWGKVIGKRIGLHASGKLDLSSMAAASRLAGVSMETMRLDMNLGRIVATTVLTGYFDEERKLHGVAPDGYDPYQDKWVADHSPYVWLFAHVLKIVCPVKARGSLMFWSPPPQLAMARYQ